MNKNWRWYIIVDEQGSGRQVFNNRIGAEDWAKIWGGEVIRVKATQQEKKRG